MLPTTTHGPRINGRHCRSYVQRREPFRNSNNQLYANTVTDSGGERYIVYSYGNHWPLHIWDSVSQQWYSNTDKCSKTTSRHFTQAHPLPSQDPTPLGLSAMLVLANHGYAGLAKWRVVYGQ